MAVIAGNWKMHHGPGATAAFLAELELADPPGHELLLFPPALSLPALASSPHLPATLQIGVQNIHWEVSGAYTGELSGGMAREAGATFALVGHSERRHVFGETDEEVTRKVAAALRESLTPVVCVGERLEERRAGKLEEVLLRQLAAALEGLGDSDARFLVAYEPVWAIGTGETASPQDASDAHAFLRARLEDDMGTARAAGVPLLYGGSVKPHNAAELLSAPEVDGVLVGGASLEAASFTGILQAAGAGAR